MEDNMIGMKMDGRYEITERIGVGGMSDVYKGRDIMEGRTVAVKILKPEFSSNEEFVRCFRNESKAIAVLSHPNIVKIFDVGHENDLEYIVMEYIDGITLKEYIEQIGLVPWRECVHYTIQILRALQLAHDRGIVHRDIKPQNVMRLSDGTIKVMDFGIARFSRQNPGTPTEKTMGSVHYVSPEQARGDRTDERSDIYSVGVMMYEMLTGRKPFDGDTPVSVALKHMNDEPVKPSQYVSGMYAGLEEIILRAMEKEPSRRYQSASGMIMDIEAFKNDQSVVFGYTDEPVKKQERSGKLLLAARGKKAVTDKPRKVKEEKPEPPAEEYVVYEEDDDDDDEPRHNYILPILAATTVTVIIVATLFLSNVILGAFKTTASSSNDYTMPELVGKNYYDARAEYPDIQLVATEEYNSENPAGIIIEQEKAEGRIVKIGDVIRVVVSKGTRMVTVPDVVNFHYNSANAALIGENLKCLRIEVESDDIAAGYVVRSDPAAYSSIEEGSTVKVYVSIGPSTEDTVVPYVVGYSVTEAEAMLNDAFLVPKIQYTESSDPVDTVISQNIAEGDTVTRNTTVTIYVSDGTGLVSDPFADPWADIDLGDGPVWPNVPEDNGGQINPGTPGVPDNTVTEPDERNYVMVYVDIPSNVSNTYSLTFYDTQTSEPISDSVVFTASNYAGSSIGIKVYGESGTIIASASLKSPRTGMKSELAQYIIDFDTGDVDVSGYSQFVFTIVDMNTLF